MDTKTVSNRKYYNNGWILGISKSKPGKHYYYNVQTKASTWTRPEDFVSQGFSPASEVSEGSEKSEKKTVKRSSSGHLADSDDSSVQGISLAKRPRSQESCSKLKDTQADEAAPVSDGDQIVSSLVAKTQTSKKGSPATTPVVHECIAPILKEEPLQPRVRISPRLGKEISPKSTLKRKRRYSDCQVENLKNTSLNKPKEPAMLRLKRLSDDLQSKNTIKEHSQVLRASQPHFQPWSQNNNSSCLNAKAVDNRSATRAHDRLMRLQAKLKSEQDARQEMPKETSQHRQEMPKETSQHRQEMPKETSQHRQEMPKETAQHKQEMPKETSQHVDECEAMDVEYVLTEIVELRQQQNEGIQLAQQTRFLLEMDLEMDIDHLVTSQFQTFYVVVDTNIILSHLKFVGDLSDTIIPGKGPVNLYFPWQVLHELDNLKDKGKTSIQLLARKAINYLHQNFSSKHPRVCGQKHKYATRNSSNCPDDNILEACLQLKEQGFTNVILLSNDINLLNKAVMSDIQALSKDQFTEQLCVNSTRLSAGHNATQSEKSDGLISCENNNFKNDVILLEMKSNLKDVLTKILSRGMKDEYNNLWEKRTIIPPPWNVHQALQCLGYHWLAICGKFIEKDTKKHIDDLKCFFKTTESSDVVSALDLKNAIELVKVVLESFPGKYRSIVGPALQNIQTTLPKLDKELDRPRNDERMKEVFSCFDEAHNAAERLCNPESVSDPQWRLKTKSMIEALHHLIRLLRSLLTTPDSLKERNPVVVDLVNLIRGDHQITAKDLINFCELDSNKALLQIGLQQFECLSSQLEDMTQSFCHNGLQ